VHRGSQVIQCAAKRVNRNRGIAGCVAFHGFGRDIFEFKERLQSAVAVRENRHVAQPRAFGHKKPGKPQVVQRHAHFLFTSFAEA
jgi:hypothetical protein